jgi:isoprenylcysteine carboxyl methyltransferase (ICMT) family protein YpbQ
MQVPAIVCFFVTALCFRLITLAVSLRHERQLKANGAVEYGKANSTALTLLHVAFYLSAFLEALRHPQAPDWRTWFGLTLYLIGSLFLVLVIRLLGRLWTLRLLIAKDHVLIRHPLFLWFKHPNYFLAVLPELIGLAFALHAWRTLLFGLPVYLVSLSVRIRQEHAAMNQAFPAYSRMSLP